MENLGGKANTKALCDYVILIVMDITSKIKRLPKPTKNFKIKLANIQWFKLISSIALYLKILTLTLLASYIFAIHSSIMALLMML